MARLTALWLLCAMLAGRQVAALATGRLDDAVWLPRHVRKRQIIRTTSLYLGNGGAGMDSRDSAVPSGYELQNVYFSPTYEQAIDVYSGRDSVDELLDIYRVKWQLACIVLLAMSSETFRLSTTFGWFHFSRNITGAGHPHGTSDVYTFLAGCYESSTYDATGSKPGKPVRNHTGTLRRAFDWTQEHAQQDGQALDQRLDQLVSKAQGLCNADLAMPKCTSRQD